MPAPTSHDVATWRVVGDPLVAPTGTGPLSGTTMAVKDLYAVAGHKIGAGNAAYLDEAEPATTHAEVVGLLLAAGAAVRVERGLGIEVEQRHGDRDRALIGRREHGFHGGRIGKLTADRCQVALVGDYECMANFPPR